jgi:hypothetical protein
MLDLLCRDVFGYMCQFVSYYDLCQLRLVNSQIKKKVDIFSFESFYRILKEPHINFLPYLFKYEEINKSLSRFGCFYCPYLEDRTLLPCLVCNRYTCRDCSIEDYDRGLGSYYSENICKKCILTNKEKSLTFLEGNYYRILEKRVQKDLLKLK